MRQNTEGGENRRMWIFGSSWITSSGAGGTIIVMIFLLLSRGREYVKWRRTLACWNFLSNFISFKRIFSFICNPSPLYLLPSFIRLFSAHWRTQPQCYVDADAMQAKAVTVYISCSGSLTTPLKGGCYSTCRREHPQQTYIYVVYAELLWDKGRIVNWKIIFTTFDSSQSKEIVTKECFQCISSYAMHVRMDCEVVLVGWHSYFYVIFTIFIVFYVITELQLIMRSNFIAAFCILLYRTFFFLVFCFRRA